MSNRNNTFLKTQNYIFSSNRKKQSLELFRRNHGHDYCQFVNNKMR
ncbi:hypothetical protein LEP1GSC051_3776 [Leptospira sp. P2653]|nr:hypothetical protein LEP1GSC051_3776 [Leptospira sp. P2653]EMN46064.1 hypothetical protein LEP1GSC086_2139 [Leptospira weilii str. LNT 1234]